MLDIPDEHARSDRYIKQRVHLGQFSLGWNNRWIWRVPAVCIGVRNSGIVATNNPKFRFHPAEYPRSLAGWGTRPSWVNLYRGRGDPQFGRCFVGWLARSEGRNTRLGLLLFRSFRKCIGSPFISDVRIFVCFGILRFAVSHEELSYVLLSEACAKKGDLRLSLLGTSPPTPLSLSAPRNQAA